MAIPEEKWLEMDSFFGGHGVSHLERLQIEGRAARAYLDGQRDPVTGVIPESAIAQLLQVGGTSATVASIALRNGETVRFRIINKEENNGS